MIRKWRNQKKKSDSNNQGWKTRNEQSDTYTYFRKYIVSHMGSYFPIGGHLVSQT